jgi:hypothetical protein
LHQTQSFIIRRRHDFTKKAETAQHQYIMEDLEYAREVAAEVGQGFETSAQKPVVVPNVPNFWRFLLFRKMLRKVQIREGKKWSGRKDLNLRPPGPELGIANT